MQTFPNSFSMLNRSKGPAVQLPRSQNDRQKYHLLIGSSRKTGKYPFNRSNHRRNYSRKCCVKGVISQIGQCYYAPIVILATGTFLQGKIHIGKISYAGGRSGEPSAEELSRSLFALGLKVRRFKTGTPPRVDLRSLDFNKLEEQKGDENPQGFSFYRDIELKNLVSCYITHTTEGTHQIIRANLTESALYSGIIKGIGPRYCPSIEDKIVKFPQRASHHIFIEPEGLNTFEGYVNGISTSLPAVIQEKIVHSIPGLEKARIIRYAYAIEYDFVDPEEIDSSLESKKIKGLYLAGQINGTSGYEEAAAQGLLAGINASLALEHKEPLILKRSDAYIGVLIDDLVTRGTNEPYRMFTSRAEYRLLLRQDNADERLMPVGYKLGLVEESRWQRFLHTQKIFQRELEYLKQHNCLAKGEIKEPVRFAQLLKRPEISISDLQSYGYQIPADVNKDIQNRLELEIKYSGYLTRMEEEMQKFQTAETIAIPEEMDYFSIPSLAYEAREKLSKIRPKNIGQAMRIPGINYSDSVALMIWLRKNTKREAK